MNRTTGTTDIMPALASASDPQFVPGLRWSSYFSKAVELLLFIVLLLPFAFTTCQNSTDETHQKDAKPVNERVTMDASKDTGFDVSITDSVSFIDVSQEASLDSSSKDSPSSIDAWDGFCDACDNTSPYAPVLDNAQSTGNITTYGSVSDPEPSRGGACNYGDTNIMNFAAINVNIESGDGLGQWQDGRICGQCVLVTAKTKEGWKSIVVRIVDKCPDEYCGIDLGGAPARELMGTKPGRYDGKWTFVPCDDHPGVSDGATSLYVKDGSNPFWALIQVRNPPAAVEAMEWETLDGTNGGSLAYATEAENFYTVPQEVRESSADIHLTIHYRGGVTHEVTIIGSALTDENASYFIGTL